VIDQAAGRCHNQVGTGAEPAFLAARFDAAIYRHRCQACVVRKALKIFFDLHGELAGRGEHQHARSDHI
jgi:hypothetical protein